MVSSNTDLNLELIARNCGLFSGESADVVTPKIDALTLEYSKSDLITIYNYMLINAKEPDIIMHLIRSLDMYRDSSSLEYLVDILLLRNADSAQDDVRENIIMSGLCALRLLLTIKIQMLYHHYCIV